MATLRLILREIQFRKLNFVFSLLGVIVAVHLFVFSFTAGEASSRETARLMRDLGLNLRIIPKTTDMDRFWISGFSDQTLPEEYVHRIASEKGLNYSHLLPTLKQRITWLEREVILVGVAPEVSPVDHKKPSMSFVIEPGTVFLGSVLTELTGVKSGAEIELRGTKLRVARGLKESGSDQDISIFGHLADIQKIAGLEGRVNEIQALNCLCADPTQDSLTVLREQLERVLPEAKVIQDFTAASARENQRRMIENYLAVALPIVLVAVAAWIGLLAFLNVRDRWQEIGILRALGYGSGQISALFLVKAILVGLIGAVVGFALGTGMALEYGPGVFKLTGGKIQPMFELLGWSLLLAPLFAAISAFIPTVVAVTQDPAVVLRDQ